MIEQALDVVIEVCQANSVDKLFIAGDTSNNYKTTLAFVDLLVQAGVDTYTIFGNHEYWSIDYFKASEIKHDRYINGKTVNLDNGTIIVGLDGFFDYSFVLDVENKWTKNIPKDKDLLNEIGERSFDLKRNRIKNYEEVFNLMKSQLISQLEIAKANQIDRVILLTHYVPSKDFIIYNNDYTWTSNNAFMGSTKYQELAEAYGIDKVVFGHTHNQFNKIINGVGYHCNPIGYKGFEFTESFRERVINRIKVIEV